MMARTRGSDPGRSQGEPRARVWLPALPFQQFHILFNSLFKVLFIFRSLYLCAIGLWPIFSFRRNLPPILTCIPKQVDSSKEFYTGPTPIQDGILTLFDILFQEIYTGAVPKTSSTNYNSDREARFQI